MKNLLKILSLTGNLLLPVGYATSASAKEGSRYNILVWEMSPKDLGPEYYMLPSAANLSAAESQRMKLLIAAAVKRYNGHIPHRYRDMRISALSKYGIQYKVSLDANGEKVVWINGFCKDDFQHKNLTTQPVFVLDGGSCYFQTVLHLKTNKAEPISTNGYA